MSFSRDVNDFRLEFQEGAEDTIRGTVLELWSQIIKSPPVDDGRFRGNWFADRNPSDEVTSRTDKSGGRTVSKATSSVIRQTDWTRFTLTNNLPYSEVIEFGGYPGDGPNTVGGFSRQAPQGVLRTNIKRFNRLLEAQAKKSLPK